MDSARAALLGLRREAAQATRVRIVARDAAGKFRLRGQLVEGRVAGVLDEAHAERPERGLRGIAHESARLVPVVAVAVPAPGGNMDRVPGLPGVTDAVDLRPPPAFDHEEDGRPRVAGGRGRGGRGGPLYPRPSAT